MAREVDILVVAATAVELCGNPGFVCGVGPVEAAASTARRLALDPPGAVVHVGLAGARDGCGVDLGSLVVGADSLYEDLVTSTPLAPAVTTADPRLVRAAAAALGVEPIRIGTSARVAGTSACPIEAMEGFAVLRSCARADVPAVEVRAVSNAIGAERRDWRSDEALAALRAALPGLVAAVAAAVRPDGSEVSAL
jgi:nucleoside phosphorylase